YPRRSPPAWRGPHRPGDARPRRAAPAALGQRGRQGPARRHDPGPDSPTPSPLTARTAMTTKASRKRATGLFLAADTAADLMTPNPVSIRAEATAQEVAALLTGKGFSAAAAIDEAGRPVRRGPPAALITHDPHGGRD